MKVLFIADPIIDWNYSEDTTPLMVKEIARRGGEVFVATYNSLFLIGEIPKIYGKKIVEFSEPFKTDELKKYNLEEFQVIHLRVDPPFDINYYYMTIFLEMVKDKVLIVNDPQSVRRFNEKLIILNFPKFITDTIVTYNIDEAEKFITNNCDGMGVAKNLGECSSRGIVLLDQKNDDIRKKLNEIFNEWKSHIMVQRYLPQVKDGETRITMINGEAKGWMKKIPKSSTFLASLDFGAIVKPCELTSVERDIVKETAVFLKKHGLILSSLDIIDGNISEINITSPGLLKHTNDIMGIKLESFLEDSISEILKKNFS